jgi:hypothetical protein
MSPSTSFSFRLATALLLLINSLDAIELVNVPCDNEVKKTSKCGAGGVFNGNGALSGTFVCRQRWGGFFFTDYESVCVPTVLDQVIGYQDDTCGCCNGACPKACSCVCDVAEDKVLVMRKQSLVGSPYECVSRGKASRLVGDGSGNFECIADSACPAIPDISTEPENTTKEAKEPEVPKRRVDPGN